MRKPKFEEEPVRKMRHLAPSLTRWAETAGQPVGYLTIPGVATSAACEQDREKHYLIDDATQAIIHIAKLYRVVVEDLRRRPDAAWLYAGSLQER